MWATTPPAVHHVHLHDPLGHGAEGALDDVLDLLPGPDLRQDLRGGEDRAETTQRRFGRRALGQGVHSRNGQAQAVGDLLEKGARPGGTLAVHLETRSAPVVIEVNHLAVLRADVDHRHLPAKMEVRAAPVAGDLGHRSIRPRHVTAAVPGGQRAADLFGGHLRRRQRLGQAAVGGFGVIHAGDAQALADHPPALVDQHQLGAGGADVNAAEVLHRPICSLPARSRHKWRKALTTEITENSKNRKNGTALGIRSSLAVLGQAVLCTTNVQDIEFVLRCPAPPGVTPLLVFLCDLCGEFAVDVPWPYPCSSAFICG